MPVVLPLTKHSLYSSVSRRHSIGVRCTVIPNPAYRVRAALIAVHAHAVASSSTDRYTGGHACGGSPEEGATTTSLYLLSRFFSFLKFSQYAARFCVYHKTHRLHRHPFLPPLHGSRWDEILEINLILTFKGLTPTGQIATQETHLPFAAWRILRNIF